MAKMSFILLLVASLFGLSTATNICTWGFYMCARSNYRCISSRDRCNSGNQCTYGEDETNCPTRCSGYYYGYFRCNNNRCTLRSNLCNGINNCGDGSDESTALCGGTAFGLRLVGGRSSSEGRVEVYYSPDRTWGTICDDIWDINDANVVCRQLGLPRATQAVSQARFGQGTGPILLDNVGCTGTELALSKCSSGGWKTHDCTHNEDAGVVCGGSPLPSGSSLPSGQLYCYTCSTSSSRCYSTRCGSGYEYCYRKTADRITGGSTSRVTVAGCTTSCTSTYKRNACRNLRNCEVSCCRTSLCNTGSSSGGSSYPSCYTCTSSSSYQDCEKGATLTRCSSSSASCYKMDYKMSSSQAELSVYSKGCTTGSSSCSAMRSTYCSSSLTDKCNVYCCTGSGCNAGSVLRFSVIALLTCAVVFFIL